MKKTTIRLISLGCSKNLVDSEKILGQLPAGRFRIVDGESPSADLAIVNTCGFIHDAREESIDTILELVEARRKGLIGQVVVTGCLSQRYMDELKEEIPEVAAWFGAREPDELLNYLQVRYRKEMLQRRLSTPSHYAYLKVSEGCDRSCSFCAIPMIRGPHVSQTPGLLVKEAGMLADKGVRELLLVAQDLSYYGIDLQSRSMLHELLQALCAVEGIRWIRLHYAYPHLFPEGVIDLMASEEKICSYLDIPLQHINDDILRSMRRGHSRRGSIALLEKIRRKVPGIALRTTLMVGYPGESDQAFRELYDFVGDFRFDRLGVFTYSPEEGTRAHPLGDPVPAHIKQERMEAIMDLQAQISLEKNQSMIGKSLEVVIDRQEGQYFVGRTQYDSPEVDNEVLVRSDTPLPPASFVQVTIEGAEAFDLYARHGSA